jgi:hypothetical protein
LPVRAVISVHFASPIVTHNDEDYAVWADGFTWLGEKQQLKNTLVRMASQG